jgi:hypothetical protein
MKMLTRLPTCTSQAWQRMVLCFFASQLVNTLYDASAGLRRRNAKPSPSRRLECPLRRSNTHTLPLCRCRGIMHRRLFHIR